MGPADDGPAQDGATERTERTERQATEDHHSQRYTHSHTHTPKNYNNNFMAFIFPTGKKAVKQKV